MLRSLRLACTAWLSVCLISSPVLALPWFRPAPATAATRLATVPALTPPHRSGELLVKYRGESTPAQRQQVRQNFSVAQQLLPTGIEVFTLADGMPTAQAVAELSKLDRVVEWVEPNYLIQVATGKKTPPSKSVRGIPQARAHRSVAAPLVAVIDTGIAAAHPRLRSHLARRGGWNFLTDTAVVSDDNGHGTQMAGIITRVHPHARLLPLKALDAEGIGAISAVVAAMDRAVAEHAQVILYSFGTEGKSQALLEAIQRAALAGVVVVTAAGNEGHDLARAPQYPAAFQAPNLLTVAASNAQQALADFSNYGALAQVAAPGVDVTTTTRPDSFTQISGTSASAAYVAGVASQLKAIRPWVSMTTINQSIMQGARRLPALAGKVRVGLVDAKAARFALLHPTPTAQNEPKKDKAPVNKRLEERKKNFDARQAMKEKPDPEMPPNASYRLDNTRNQRPARPENRVKINARQGAGYDDPVPTDTANFPAYFTEMVKATNDTGVAGSKPLQQVDPTAGNSVIGLKDRHIY